MVTSSGKTSDKDATLSEEDRRIAEALGKELWRIRETRGWTREQLVARLPSGIGIGALQTYERGTRQIGVLRLVELSRALETHPAKVLLAAVPTDPFDLEKRTILVDLPSLVENKSFDFRLIRRWAAGKLDSGAKELVEVPPLVVGELACVVGCSHYDLALYLAGFTSSLSDMPLSTDDD